jgi:hypothetical protein
MIVNGYPKQVAGENELLRDLDIFVTRFSVPRRVIVREDNEAGRGNNGPSKDFSGMDEARINEPFGDYLEAEDCIAGAQPEHNEAFSYLIVEQGVVVLDQGLRRAYSEISDVR